MTKLEQLQKELLQRGYRKIESNLQQFSLFYIVRQGQACGILLAETDKDSELTARQLKHVREQVYRTMEQLGENPALLTLIAGEDTDHFRDIPA